jgi:hypothetical protein
MEHVNIAIKAIETQLNGWEVIATEHVQELWSGYGQIVRLMFKRGPVGSAILKVISPPSEQHHPRGWSTNLSHERKCRSYDIEMDWYKHYAAQQSSGSPFPKLLAQSSDASTLKWILMEDMDAMGFPLRLNILDKISFYACIKWLAHFHGQYMGHNGHSLWEQGTYWHLETRPDELKAMAPSVLKDMAEPIDTALSNATHLTIVHGDAKCANFCFSKDHHRVAAVDFQYVGRGCGMKDLAYFMGSCYGEAECAKMEYDVLDVYFKTLKQTLTNRGLTSTALPCEQEWRQLYPLAWADFYRFLEGWCPDHHKINAYGHHKVQQSLEFLSEQNIGP